MHVFLRALCEIFVFLVVKFYHEGHKGNTQSSQRKLTFHGVAQYSTMGCVKIKWVFVRYTVIALRSIPAFVAQSKDCVSVWVICRVRQQDVAQDS